MANQKVIDALKAINKQYGANKVRFAKDEPAKEALEWCVPELNEFCPMLVRGNFSVLWGSKSVGKSTLVYQTIAHLQKQKLVCCLIDAEHSFDTVYAKKCGIDLSELVLIEDINTAEEGMDMIISLCKSKTIDLFVVDSVQAMSPEGEQITKKGKEKSIADDEMAQIARKLSKFFRVCAGPLYQSNAHCLLIGQVRKNLGGFIVLDQLSGGEAQSHWAVGIMHMRPGQGADAPVEKIKQEIEDTEGNIHKETVTVKVGHDVVFKINKAKITGSKPVGSDIHIVYHNESGFLPLIDKTTVVTVEADSTDIVEPKVKKGKKK